MRPQVWRVFPAEQGKRNKGGLPARVCHIFQVARRGDWGLADLAAAQRGVARLTASIDEVAHALNEARMLELVFDAEIDAAIARRPNRPGIRRLRAAQAGEHGGGHTRLEFERRFRRLARDGALPPPVDNAPLLGVRADVRWARERVIVGSTARGRTDGHGRFTPTAAAISNSPRRGTSCCGSPGHNWSTSHTPCSSGSPGLWPLPRCAWVWSERRRVLCLTPATALHP